MNLQQLNDLDLNDIARWPKVAKGIFILFCCALLGMLLYEKLHFSAVVTVAACMVSAIALPWLFGKLIRLCRLDDIFKKIGLPA